MIPAAIDPFCAQIYKRIYSFALSQITINRFFNLMWHVRPIQPGLPACTRLRTRRCPSGQLAANGANSANRANHGNSAELTVLTWRGTGGCAERRRLASQWDTHTHTASIHRMGIKWSIGYRYHFKGTGWFFLNDAQPYTAVPPHSLPILPHIPSGVTA